jgi:hypothetical protein
MVQNCDNDILDGLAVANLLQTQNPLFLSWRDWRLSLLFPSKPTIEVKCSLIDEYVKKPSAHGTSTFNGSSVCSEEESSFCTLQNQGLQTLNSLGCFFFFTLLKKLWFLIQL